MNLRQVLTLIPPFIIFLIFSGCYDTPYPIDVIEKSELDISLLGKWERNGNSSNRQASVEVSRLNNNEYKILYHDQQRGTFKLRAHPSDHAGWTFLNARSLESNDSDSEYSLFAYKFEDTSKSLPDQVTLYLLRVTLPHFDSADELRAFISTHIEHPSILFEQGMLFDRSS